MPIVSIEMVDVVLVVLTNCKHGLLCPAAPDGAVVVHLHKHRHRHLDEADHVLVLLDALHDHVVVHQPSIWLEAKALIPNDFIFPWYSPEASAAILWKNSKASQKAAEKLKITANKLCKLQIADGIIHVRFFIICMCWPWFRAPTNGKRRTIKTLNAQISQDWWVPGRTTSPSRKESQHEKKRGTETKRCKVNSKEPSSVASCGVHVASKVGKSSMSIIKTKVDGQLQAELAELNGGSDGCLIKEPTYALSTLLGRFTDLKSEELGQGEAIVHSLRTMFGSKGVHVASKVGKSSMSIIKTKVDEQWQAELAEVNGGSDGSLIKEPTYALYTVGLFKWFNYADHHGFPVVTFSDTPRAFTDLKSEELGKYAQSINPNYCLGEATAHSLRTLFGLKVLDASGVICEGGSEVLSKFEYPWAQAADLNVKRRSSYLISQFKPLKEKV
ncbi:acetyl-coenzyme A carboxylase carboxyl transferase subunit alpha, chloroplastic [Artemisia annua]|uniref:Acetyl-coenzyme A carboxylase carboxyl transferase subunit alpha, chloroplastic n=1 Tax=Artemisia annua TaxID=35608 RepID=A0A2U1QPD3_ARTAN|nr:acetyl-coenzyme A carboxylase carboxyl transferase subunit alpha, chloroplastic [Artemisia annua]